MKKQLGFLTSLIFLCSSVLLWTGCNTFSDGSCSSSCEPVCEQPCQPVCQPACQPAQCATVCANPCEQTCHVGKCQYPSHNELCCKDGITVRAKNPSACLLGEQYPLEFEVYACDDVCEASVTTELPNGVLFGRSEPPAKVDGQRVEWEFGKMHKGECRYAKIWVECQCEGELCACFCAKATPVRFCSLLCANPVLTCQKCGPEEVCPGDPINYTVTVTNSGSCAAEEVMVTDHLPDGVEHSSGMRTLCYKLGSLQPCESKSLNICVRACERGEICNKVTVSACNASPSTCEWCTCVCCCDVAVTKIGPKELQIGSNADYQITVTNTGDKTLTDVIVTDTIPTATSVVQAKGARVCGNEVVWALRELGAGEKRTFVLTLTTCTPGCFTNKVGVTTCQGCYACSEFSTRWKGRPAISACIADSNDMICVGQHTSYRISVVNQGSEADDNVRVVVRFPPELTPTEAKGPGMPQISGSTVTFGPIDNFRPRQTSVFRVDAKAVRSGDARVIVEISSDAFKTPLVEQESTIVN